MKMIDFVKVMTEHPTQVKNLYKFAETHLQPRKPQNNYYLAFGNGSGRFRLEFRKAVSKGEIIGFRRVEICFSPHYLFNDDLHNGNDFSPHQCIEVINSVFTQLGLSKTDLKHYSVVNIEFGLNLKISNVPEVVNGIIYTKRTPFKTNGIPTFKISNSTKHKEVKAYDKGEHFRAFPMYGIGEVFRFEIRAKKSRTINVFGISKVSDLLNANNYNALFQSLVNEWENILVINPSVKDEVNSPKFWEKILQEKNRNRFGIEKQKYYKNLPTSCNLHRAQAKRIKKYVK